MAETINKPYKAYSMYFGKREQEEAQRAIEAIRQVGAEARKSKESARQFLIDAGIIEVKRKRKASVKKK